MLGLHWGNGKENGNYYNGLYRDYRVYHLWFMWLFRVSGIKGLVLGLNV